MHEVTDVRLESVEAICELFVYLFVCLFVCLFIPCLCVCLDEDAEYSPTTPLSLNTLSLVYTRSADHPEQRTNG